jgi:anti-anti-sigma factor
LYANGSWIIGQWFQSIARPSHREDKMNHPQLESTGRFVSGIRELVRGREQEFINELRPLMQSQTVCLDMSKVERIDAAGLAVLISLCRDARLAGHELTVVHPSRQVVRILALVGLDRLIVSGDSARAPGPQPRINLVAA